VIFYIQDAYPIVLRPNPNIPKPVFKQGVDLVATDVAVGLQVIDRFHCSSLQADGPRTACGNPDIAFAVLYNAIEIAKIGNMWILKTDVPELLRIAVE
jgi:hypothetical protein